MLTKPILEIQFINQGKKRTFKTTTFVSFKKIPAQKTYPNAMKGLSSLVFFYFFEHVSTATTILTPNPQQASRAITNEDQA